MYICTECGDVVEELPYGSENVPYGNDYATWEYSETDCEHCDGQYVEAMQCPICKEWISVEEKVHNDCLKKAHNLDNALEIGGWFGGEEVKVNKFLVYALGEKKINEILTQVYKKLPKEVQEKHIGEFLDDYYLELKDLIVEESENE
jgi:hypothetical protein